MSLYGVGLMPLASRMGETIPKALQPWYCDDAGAAGKALPNARCLDFLVKFGPQYGYFPEPGKSYYICKAEDKEAARKPLKASASTSTTQEGSATSAASLGALRRRRNGWSGWWTSGRLWWSPSALLLSGILRQRSLASPSACRTNGSMSSK